jgi:hypothetical protein
VAAECPFCGDLMVRSIDKPLISDEEAKEAAGWDVN